MFRFCSQHKCAAHKQRSGLKIRERSTDFANTKISILIGSTMLSTRPSLAALPRAVLTTHEFMTLNYFSEMLPVLADRAKLATLSQLRFANRPLRQHLAQLFERPYGEPGAFL